MLFHRISVNHILVYKDKNLRLKVSYKWFLKRGALLYSMRKFDLGEAKFMCSYHEKFRPTAPSD